MKEIDFEKYLMDQHAKEYTGTDDDMPDDFDYWLSELDVYDFIKYANEYAAKVRNELE